MTTARDIPVMPQRSAAWYLAATTALFCLIFILDILIPQGYSVPTLYLLPLVFSYRIPNRYAPAYAAALTTALTLAGLMVSPMGDLSAAYFNRSLAILASWVMAISMLYIRGHQERLELTNLVAQKSEELVCTNAALETQIAALAAAEKTLRETEDRFNLVVTATQIGIWDWDLRTNRMYYSPRWKQSLGYEEHEVSDAPSEWHSRFHPEDRARAMTLLDQFLSGEALSYRLEHRLRHRDGSYRWILTEATLLRDPEGVAFRMTGSHLDITEQKRSEAALRESEERYRGVITALAEGVVVQDTEGRIVACNPSACQILGLSSDHLIGRSSLDPTWHAIHEDGLPFPGETHPVMTTLQTGVAQSNVVMGVSRPDGGTRWISINTEPLIRPDASRPYAVVASFRDITAWKETERRLRQQKHEFRVLADNVPGFFSYIDRHYKYQFVNKAYETFFGLPAHRLVGRPLLDLMGPESFGYIKPYLEAALAGQSIAFEYQITRPESPARWMKVNYVPDTSIGGATRGVFALITDVTASRQAEAALRQSESTLRSFFDSGLLMMGIVELQGDEIVHVSDNAKTAAFLGTTPERMRNRTSTALGVPRTIVDTWIRHYREAARTGIPVKFDYDHLHNGPIQHFTATVCFIGRGPSGHPRFSYAVADMTEHRQASDQLRRNLNLISAIMNGTTDAVFLKSLDGRYLMVNPAAAAAVGRTVPEMIGQTDWTVLSPESARRLVDHDRQVISAGSTHVLEEVLDIGGVPHTFLSTKDVYRDETGRVVGVIGISRDITERKRVEAELQAANERYRDLSHRLIEILEQERRAIAHDLHDELGQLMTAIKLEISGLKRKLRGDSSTLDVAGLQARVQSSLELVDQVIDASRHAAMGLRPTHLDDLGLVAAIQWLAKDLENRADILCELVTAPDQGTLDLDETMSTGMFRIAQELLTNVARHAKASEVHISILQAAGTLVLKIEDNGIGITAEAASRSGGLGLRGVRERCCLLNGEFAIEAVAGRGTIATVKIPLSSRTTSATLPTLQTKELQS
jgi:PAS domain S-box-containing protein